MTEVSDSQHRRLVYARTHSVPSCACVRCGATVNAEDRVTRKRTRSGEGAPRSWGVTSECVKCRMIRAPQPGMRVRERQCQWGTFDYTAWAEREAYPDRKYMQLTMHERQHAYWLCRVRWAGDGMYRHMMSYRQEDERELRAEEKRRLLAMRTTLVRRGCRVDFSPYTDWLDDANDYAHDHGRHAGTPESGRNDIDLDGDGAGEEAA